MSLLAVLWWMTACDGSEATDTNATANTDTDTGTASSSGTASTPSTGPSDTTTSASGSGATTGTPTDAATDSSGSTETAPSTGPDSDDTTSSSTTTETGTTGGSDSSSSTQGSSGESTTDSGSSNSPPVLLSTSINPSTLTGSGSVTITLVATDPDGIDDLIGGTVNTPDGVSYGALVSAADEGAYSFELDWDLLHSTVNIEFPPNENETRSLTITVFDQAGESVSEDLEVVLEASQPGLAVCDGSSVSWDSDQHCGACGFSCLDPLESTMGPGECLAAFPNECEKQRQISLYDPSTTCQEACDEAAGPQADAVAILSCFPVGVGGGCVDPEPSQCPGYSVDTLPANCNADAGTSVRCLCVAHYYNPNDE